MLLTLLALLFTVALIGLKCDEILYPGFCGISYLIVLFFIDCLFGFVINKNNKYRGS